MSQAGRRHRQCISKGYVPDSRHCWHCVKSSLTAHEAEGFCLISRSESIDYNIIRMAMIAGIDCGRGEKHVAMWLRCFWAFDAYLEVGTLWTLGELTSSGLLMANKSIWCLHLRTDFYSGFSKGVVHVELSGMVETLVTWQKQKRADPEASVCHFLAPILLTRRGTIFDRFDLSKILSFQRHRTIQSPDSEYKRDREDRDG